MGRCLSWAGPLGMLWSAVSVTVLHGAEPGTTPDGRPLSFVGDVLPILAKKGCSSSGCHANPEGQNGFKLSVFSYDPRADFESMVREGRGRRVSPGAPDLSLVLLKATQQLPHEGGARFAVDSAPYRTVRRWIEEGMAYRLPDEPRLEGISIDGDGRVVSRGETGHLVVQARFSDGGTREVTGLAHFASSDASFVEVDDEGSFRVGQGSGEGAVVARYMGQVAIVRMSVPPDRVLPPDHYAGLERVNLIDEHAVARWAELGLFPSVPCSDSEFLRRASLDLIGALPTVAQVRAFLADRTADKRRRLVDELLEDPRWADRWALVWVDLLRPNPDRVGVKSVYVLDQWLRESFRRNVGFDQFARDVLTVSGSTHRDGPAVIFRDRRTPADLTTMFSQVFMGVRLECAKCHQHPNESWSQEDFYRLAAFFGEVGRKGTGISPPISGSAEFIFHKPGGEVRHPVTDEVMVAAVPHGEAAAIADGCDPREVFADWLLAPENPFFARAVVNRVWGALLGSGIVNPVDDLRTSNPPSNPALLDALARDFVAQRYDLKALMRRIVNARVYQLSSLPNESNLRDTVHFSRAYRRRLGAEAMTDAVADVCGVPDRFAGMPPGARALETWNFKLDSDLLDAFGRPDSSEDCPCERTRESSVVQSLHLMHAERLQEKLAHPEGRVARLVGSELAPPAIVEELYLAALGRFPDRDEQAVAVGEFARDGATRQSAAEDLLWALINSAEFVYNH